MTQQLALIAALATALAVWMPLGAQTPAATPQTFEVISVKPNVSGEQSASFSIRPGWQLVVRNNSLRNIVRNAYQLQNYQIVTAAGTQSWFDRDRFDITATSPKPDPTIDEFRGMVQALLAERFGLRVHREMREMPIYALVLARPDGRFGPQLHRSTMDCEAVDAAARRGAPPPPLTRDGRPTCGTRMMPGRMIAGGATMADLARNISNSAGRMTLDRTGLAGGFDFTVEFTPDQLPLESSLPAGLPRPPADGPSLFTAMQEQLGLKLDSQRGPVDVLVIDAAQPPTPD